MDTRYQKPESQKKPFNLSSIKLGAFQSHCSSCLRISSSLRLKQSRLFPGTPNRTSISSLARLHFEVYRQRGNGNFPQSGIVRVGVQFLSLGVGSGTKLRHGRSYPRTVVACCGCAIGQSSRNLPYDIRKNQIDLTLEIGETSQQFLPSHPTC
jgi:hypothetical protein